MKIAILSTCYAKQIDEIYKKHAFLHDLDYEEQVNTILKISGSFLYYWKKYSKNSDFVIKVYCHDLYHLFRNSNCVENNSSASSSEDLFIKSIESFSPKILFIFSPHYYKDLANHVRDKVSSIKKIVSWYGADQGDEKKTFSHHDLVLSNSKVLRDRLISSGLKSEILNHAFEPSMYDEILKNNPNVMNRKNKIVFTGTLGLENPDHHLRYKSLEQLSQSVPLEMFSGDKPYQKTKKQFFIEYRYNIANKLLEILNKHTPSRVKSWADARNQPSFPQTLPSCVVQSLYNAVYGKEMLEKLSSYTICFNNHNSATGDSACNMRLFEATGMGCCLLTDHKSDISSIFEPDLEVITYKTTSEAIDKAKYLLDNPKTTKQIAEAGQQRTFTEHTTKNQVEKLVFYLKNLLN